jgi:hypothetical protein
MARRVVSILFTAGAMACIGSAAPAVLSCPIDTLTNYTAPGFTCFIGDRTFANFVLDLNSTQGLGTATPALADSVLVLPNPAGDSGFNFQAAFEASGALARESLSIGYTGTAPEGDPFGEARLSLNGASVTGAATITAALAVCQDGSFSGLAAPLTCSSGQAINPELAPQITNANLAATAALVFTPVTKLGVVVQIQLTGAAFGSAAASSFENDVPASETGSWVMAAAGLALFVRRKLRTDFRKGRVRQ